jgi:hypothetical protein
MLLICMGSVAVLVRDSRGRLSATRAGSWLPCAKAGVDPVLVPCWTKPAAQRSMAVWGLGDKGVRTCAGMKGWRGRWWTKGKFFWACLCQRNALQNVCVSFGHCVCVCHNKIVCWRCDHCAAFVLTPCVFYSAVMRPLCSQSCCWYPTPMR